MKNQIRKTVWYNVSDEAAGKNLKLFTLESEGVNADRLEEKNQLIK